MSDTVGPTGDKHRITIRVDGVTYTLLSQYAKHLGVPTANHAAFTLVVKGVRQLREQYEWAESVWHLATLADIEHRGGVLRNEDQ